MQLSGLIIIESNEISVEKLIRFVLETYTENIFNLPNYRMFLIVFI